MNDNNTAATAAQAPNRAGLGRLQGISVIASVLLPILAACLVYYTGLGMPEGTINQGELLQPPVKVDRLPFMGRDGEKLDLAGAEPKWRYLILPAGECGAECEKLLYTSRQVHVRLGEKADRVERLLVTATPATGQLQQKLQQEYPRLHQVQLEEGALQRLWRETSRADIADTRALLVDQQGFVMMAYDNRHSGNQLLEDIKRLLKYSYEP